MKRAGTAITFLILGMLLVPAAGWLYLRFAHVPVAVADPMLPFEETLARSTLHARIDRERAKTDPVEVNEANLQAGAATYMQACSYCHGTPGSESSIGNNTFPRTPQFFRARPGGNRAAPDVTRRSASYHWYIQNGVRLTAMPSYKMILTENEQWQVSNMLAVRETGLPESVKKILAAPAN